MLNQIYDDIKVVDFVAKSRRLDPLTLETLAHNKRQVEIALFISSAFKKVVDGIAAWYRGNVLARDLNAMPDYILKDIGIRRDQINAVVEGKLVRKTAPETPVAVATDDKVDNHPLAA